jgi:hypothetical protein
LELDVKPVLTVTFEERTIVPLTPTTTTTTTTLPLGEAAPDS